MPSVLKFHDSARFHELMGLLRARRILLHLGFVLPLQSKILRWEKKKVMKRKEMTEGMWSLRYHEKNHGQWTSQLYSFYIDLYFDQWNKNRSLRDKWRTSLKSRYNIQRVQSTIVELGRVDEENRSNVYSPSFDPKVRVEKVSTTFLRVRVLSFI